MTRKCHMGSRGQPGLGTTVVTGAAERQARDNTEITAQLDMSPDSEQDIHRVCTDLHARATCSHPGFLWKAPQVRDAAACPGEEEGQTGAGAGRPFYRPPFVLYEF